MKKIYLTLLTILAVITLKAAPDIYTPELTAPENNATGIFPNVLLDWDAVTGQLGLYYEINLDTTADFSNPVVYTTDETSYQMSLLHFGQTYFWRIRAVDNSATSEWSVVRNFTVINTVNIRKPSNDAANVAPNVAIIWTELPGATKVTYQLDTAQTFDSPMMTMVTVNNVDPFSTNASSLHFGQKYYLRMRASHSADTSEWTASRYFTVTNTLGLKNPVSGTAGLSPDVQFEWTKIDGLLKYQIYLSKDSDMNQYETYNVAAKLTKIIPDTLLFGTTYYWQLAAIHAEDTLLSEMRNFTTIDKVVLTSPSNNATNVELQPTLTWETLTGLVTFQLEISHNSDFSNAFSYTVDDGGENTFKVPVNVLDSANVYYWRVRAISSRDTSSFSDTWSFRSVTLGMEENATVINTMKLYPSPASNKVDIRVKNTINGLANIEVYDLLGNKRTSSSVNFSNGVYKDFPVGSLSNGIYMMSIIVDGQRITSKLIIQK